MDEKTLVGICLVRDVGYTSEIDGPHLQRIVWRIELDRSIQNRFWYDFRPSCIHAADTRTLQKYPGGFSRTIGSVFIVRATRNVANRRANTGSLLVIQPDVQTLRT